MYYFDNVEIDRGSFAYTDLLGQSKWSTWTPVFTSLTTTGTPTLSGRYRIVGRSVEYQVKIVPGTNTASTADTTYFALPIAAKGFGGVIQTSASASMTLTGTSKAIDATNSRGYCDGWAASTNTIFIAGNYER